MTMDSVSNGTAPAASLPWTVAIPKAATVAVLLATLAGVATAAAASETTIRYLSFATMVAALVAGVIAVRRGPAWLRAVSAGAAVITLMLGSTFFGLTYS